MLNEVEDMALARSVGVETEVIVKARRNLREGLVYGLAVSGKLASGKDTVAEMVMDRLGKPGAVQLTWATALRRELDVVLQFIREADTPREACQYTCGLGIETHHAQNIVEKLWDCVRREGATAHSRTPQIRWALQYLGTDVRRAQDQLHWVRLSIKEAADNLSNGVSVYYTDCRHPNEVEVPRQLGFYAVRLEITPETQRSRLWGRDGIGVDAAAATHPSEVMLDGYAGFDLIVDNNGDIEHAVETICAGLKTRYRTH
jgi:hypothetical protein